MGVTRIWLCAGVLTCAGGVCPSVGFAQPSDGVSDDTAAEQDVLRERTDVFAPGVRHLELTAAFLSEAWDFNAGREELYGGRLAYGRGFAQGWAHSFEAGVLRVRQERTDDVFLSTLSWILRRRVWQRSRVTAFAEGGPGVSYATRAVPHRGTRFNWLIQGGAGANVQMGVRSYLVSGLRWFHLSNSVIRGRRRNPDIQALGGYVGLAVF